MSRLAPWVGLAASLAVAFAGDAPPARLASLSPAATRIVRDLGATDRLALATRWCDLPEGHAATRESDALAPDLERLARMRPDLVIVPRLSNPLLAERIRSLGLPVLVLAAESPESPADDIVRIGARLGASAAAQRLLATRTTRTPGDRRLLVIWDGVCAGPSSYLAWVAAASGHVLAPDAGAWPEWDREQAGRWRPDVVLYLSTEGPEQPEADARRLAEWRHDPALRLTVAASTGCVWVVRPGSKWLPASGLPEAAAQLRALPQPDGVR